jgi:hypothetical protein
MKPPNIFVKNFENWKYLFTKSNRFAKNNQVSVHFDKISAFRFF